MKKIICGLLALASSFTFAQSILNAKSPEEFRKLREENKEKINDNVVSVKVEPLKYGYIEDKDILKSVMVWEVIDLNDKINQPIYHNSDGVVTKNDAILAGKIKEVYDDEMFQTRLNPESIADRVRYTTLSNAGIEKMNEQGKPLTEAQKKEYTDVYEVKSKDVKLIKIKGMWYIDKRDSQMKYRLLGIAAMGQDPTTMGQVGADGMPIAQDDAYIDLFWIFYPDAREVLANAVVFNGRNLSSDISYDDILNARRFSSVIYKSGTGVGTGNIKDLFPNDADAQLEESDRIKDLILEMENDMWNY